jgi:hypothetical protein
MTRIFLDVNDRVCLDRTLDGEYAAKAKIDRDALRLAKLYVGLFDKIAVLRNRSGRSAASARRGADQARQLCAEIKVGAS